MTIAKCIRSLLGFVSLAFVLDSCGQKSIDFGPLFQEFHLTLAPGWRAEAIGPLLSYEERDRERHWSWTPLLSYHLDPATDSEEWDFGYPILTYDRFGSQYRFQIGQLFSFSGGENLASNAVKRFTLFPLYFQQRASDPALNYTAVFPVFGHLKDRLFRDEIDFLLWPLYIKTKRRAALVPSTDDGTRALPYRSLRERNREITTYNYVYPIFHLRYGDQLKGWQVWPLAGWEQKGITSRTNSLDELEVIGGHQKRFLMWPFFFENELDIGTSNPKRELVSFPFYSGLRSPNRDSSTYLWPLFTVTDDRENHYREFDLLGPLCVVARGPGKTANRVWPLFSRAKKGGLESAFYFWPVYKYDRAYAPPLDRRRTRICFFLYNDTVEEDLETHRALQRTALFPLFTAWRDREGNERLQVLALLEPFVPTSKSIERNYSPAWSLWRSEKNARTGAASQSLLWNLYRRDTAPGRKKSSLLFGLFQYQSMPEGKRVRLFYIPLGKTQPPPAVRVQP
jgi:hypothetical protein